MNLTRNLLALVACGIACSRAQAQTYFMQDGASSFSISSGFTTPQTATFASSFDVTGGTATISGGGTLSLGGFTLTVPATDTAALLGTAQTFSAANTFSAAVTHKSTLLLTTATNGLGYGAGSGGTVTQGTNRTTAVTLNQVSGQITTATTSLAALAAATFTVTNSAVASTDMVLLSEKSGATNVKTALRVTATGTGTFSLTVHNIDASTAETGAIVINMLVIKGSSN